MGSTNNLSIPLLDASVTPLIYQLEMRTELSATAFRISGVSSASWKNELEKTSYRYHNVAVWAAIIFDPVFAITDYYNIPENWKMLFAIRCGVSFITLAVLILARKNYWPSFIIVFVPFFLISLQNAFTYSLIGEENLLGHSLNYMALLIGAAMFLAWQWGYSVMMIMISALATSVFLWLNPVIETNVFFVKGGLLLIAVGLFMIVLIKTRYDLTVKEIKARLALQASNEEIQAQDEEMKRINENLEVMVHERTKELERKNAALEEYAFINAHKLRSPVASILGLTNLIRNIEVIQSDKEAKTVCDHLEESSRKLDSIVRSITIAIEKGD
jgi:signal transduction histidine kinase